jgi:hypothetical protein
MSTDITVVIAGTAATLPSVDVSLGTTDDSITLSVGQGEGTVEPTALLSTDTRGIAAALDAAENSPQMAVRVKPEAGDLTWVDLVLRWDTQPAEIGATANGKVLAYTLSGTTRYRLIPDPYVFSEDAFYDSFVGGVLSGSVIRRV